MKKIMLSLVFIMFFIFGYSQTLSNGFKFNKYGVMHSHSLRYNIETNKYLKKPPVQVGFEYSRFIDGNNPNKNQLTFSGGIYLNDDCSLELEANYILTDNNRDGVYYNVGFRLDTRYNVSYDIKLGQSIIQLGVLYTVDLKKILNKFAKRNKK